MRRRSAKKREISPDFKYNNVNVSKLINYVMRKGKKDTASNIVYKAFENIKLETEQDPVVVFEEAIENARPLMQVKSRRVGGATYPVPMEVSFDRSRALALTWFVMAIKERVMKDAVKDLQKVLVDSYNKTGFAVAKKVKSHQEAQANKAFAHFRW